MPTIIVCPTARERNAVRRKVGDVAWVKCGIGVEKAVTWARRLGECDRVILVGFGGALTDDLKPGDLVCDGGDAPGARRGKIATVDRVLLERAEKEALARETGAVAADMEAKPIVEAAEERGITWLHVRAIVDTPSAPLATDYLSAKGWLKLIGRGFQGVWADKKNVELATAALRAWSAAAFGRS